MLWKSSSKKNAKINEVENRITFISSDLFTNIPEEKYDIIVSNPPYIKRNVIETLDEQVRKEPYMALDGGLDGLDFYRKIIEDCVQHLNPNGEIYFEYGMGQAQDIEKLLKKDFECITIIKDYYNIERFIYAKLKENIC